MDEQIQKKSSKGLVTSIVVLVLILAGAIFAFTRSGTKNTVINNPSVGNIVSTTTPSTQVVKSFTLEDVAKHNTEQDCYTVVSGSVYDLTSWILQHPGGKRAIIGMCGIDATSAFIGQHGGQARPEQELATFKIGVLKN